MIKHVYFTIIFVNIRLTFNPFIIYLNFYFTIKAFFSFKILAFKAHYKSTIICTNGEVKRQLSNTNVL